MANNFDPRQFRLGSSYRFFYQNLNRLPRNRWTLAIVLMEGYSGGRNVM